MLIGTRGLLGEGWDCPQLNVLVDMTAVAADVSVRQMRGRSLRLDPADPEKLASNWDVVCVAPDLERGHADYGRFIRRHAHLHAPCEDGTIETGPSHVHPELSPYGPPPAEEFGAINAEQRDAGDRPAGRARALADRHAVPRRRPRRAGGAPAAPGGAEPNAVLGAAAAAAAAAGLARGAALGMGSRAYPRELPLEWAAAAVCEAYVALGEAPPARSRRSSSPCGPRAGCAWRCPTPSPATAPLVTAALDDVVGGGGLPRYVVSRVAAGRTARCGTAVPERPGAPQGPRRGVPPRVVALVRARSRLVYAHGSDEGARLAAQALAAPAHATQRRRIWR